MTFQETNIAGAWLYQPKRFADERGYFQETFKHSALLEATGFDFQVKQVNQSKSSAGVVRGVHWADVPPGQAKYVTVPVGEIWDLVIDLRTDSPTFGTWQGFHLSAENGHSLIIGNGLGHAFLSLKDDTIVSYLCSEEFNPTREHAISPLDEDLAITFESKAGEYSIEKLSFSEKDSQAPSLKHYLENGLLPKVTL
jgi:dTDP-4-dehydrorhamnose 3,5-epimerase